MQLVDILLARQRIAPYVRRTPLVTSAWAGREADADVRLKLESLQASSSFKSRGAFNAVIALLERSGGERRPIVTASAGNHGRALAEAAEIFGLSLVVFTPANAPRAKRSAIQSHGADLRAECRDYDDAERVAKAFGKETGAHFISPYSDTDVIAGAGTIALEILEDWPELDCALVPIGGGGLVSGVGTALKLVSPAIEVIGVEAERSHAFQTSLAAGRLVEIVPGDTIADGLGGNPEPETITFAFIQKCVDGVVTVSEEDLIAAIVGLAEHDHVIAEGAGAASTAAIVRRRADLRGRRVVSIVTGSNIDLEKLIEIGGRLR